jgi:hypothetical protein
MDSGAIFAPTKQQNMFGAEAWRGASEAPEQGDELSNVTMIH